MKFTKHVAGEMTEQVQSCVICGHKIIDERNMISPKGTPPSKGYELGPVNISNGNPRITMIADPSDDYETVNCSVEAYLNGEKEG